MHKPVGGDVLDAPLEKFRQNIMALSFAKINKLPHRNELLFVSGRRGRRPLQMDNEERRKGNL